MYYIRFDDHGIMSPVEDPGVTQGGGWANF